MPFQGAPTYTPPSLLATASVQKESAYVSGCNPATGWGMPSGSYIPNIGPTSYNPCNYTGITASCVPHDDGVTWSLVDNNRGVIQQVLVPNPELAATGATSGVVLIQSNAAQRVNPSMGAATGSMPIQSGHRQDHQGSTLYTNFQQSHLGSAPQFNAHHNQGAIPQQSHRQNPVHPEISRPQAEGQPLNQNQPMEPQPAQGVEQPAPEVDHSVKEVVQPVQRAPQIDWTSHIADVISNQFGLKPNVQYVMYRTPYPPAYDQLSYPHRYNMPDFTEFSGHDDISKVEHINEFLVQCREAASNNALSVRLFSSSLSGLAFVWFMTLPANSIRLIDRSSFTSTYLLVLTVIKC